MTIVISNYICCDRGFDRYSLPLLEPGLNLMDKLVLTVVSTDVFVTKFQCKAGPNCMLKDINRNAVEAMVISNLKRFNLTNQRIVALIYTEHILKLQPFFFFFFFTPTVDVTCKLPTPYSLG